MKVVVFVVCVLAVVVVLVDCGYQMQVERMLSGQAMAHETYIVPNLPYKYDAYEPWLDAKTVEAHHQQVHKERCFQMNKLLKEWRKSVSAQANLVVLPCTVICLRNSLTNL